MSEIVSVLVSTLSLISAFVLTCALIFYLTDKRDDDPSGGYVGCDGVRTYFVTVEEDGPFFRATQK